MKKYLKSLSKDESRLLIRQSKEMSGMIKMDDWDAANYNGNRLIKFIEGSEIILNKAKAALNLEDDQMKSLIEYLKQHYPEATLKPIEEIEAEE